MIDASLAGDIRRLTLSTTKTTFRMTPPNADAVHRPGIALKGGGNEWLEEAFRRYERPLLSYALRFFYGDLERARDCVQDVFLALCNQPQAAIASHLEAWLFKTCRNRAIDFQRRRTHMVSSATDFGLDSVSDPDCDLQASQARHEQQDAVLAAVAQLPEREQELLTLRLTHELSYKQIAEVTGLSVSNVGYLLHQAIAKLRTACLDA